MSRHASAARLMTVVATLFLAPSLPGESLWKMAFASEAEGAPGDRSTALVLDAIRDTFLSESDPGTNHGTEAELKIKQDPGETANVVSYRPEDLFLMKTYLARWREGLRAVSPVYKEIDRETVDKLKALGYLN